MNVQVEELQQYGNQLLSHWIRENNKLKYQQEQSYHYDYKNVEYKPTVKYNNIAQKQKSLVKMRSCSSDLLYNEKSVSDQYEPATRSC
jgi:hypothetical protein